MKRVLKKITGIVMASAMTISALTFGKVDAKAATPINLNQEYRVNIKSKAEFTFVTPEDGVVSVEAAVVDTKTYGGSVGVKLTVDYADYWNGIAMLGRGKEYSDGFTFKPGQIATVTLDGYYYDWEGTVAFKVNCTNPGNLEKEKNNTPGQATKIDLKKTYNGVVTSINDDEDWYVFKASRTGKYKFYAVNAKTNGNAFVRVEGYKTKSKKDPGFDDVMMTGRGWAKSKSVKLKKGKKYYIKFSSPSYLENVPVQVKVKKVK